VFAILSVCTSLLFTIALIPDMSPYANYAVSALPLSVEYTSENMLLYELNPILFASTFFLILINVFSTLLSPLFTSYIKS